MRLAPGLMGLLLVSIFVVPIAIVPASAANSNLTFRGPARLGPSGSSHGAFAFVSNFEAGTPESNGWTTVSGTTPTIVTSPSYSGEPALKSSATGGTQVDVATSGFVMGDRFLSFQVAINTRNGAGFFGFTGPSGPVAVVGLVGNKVVAGDTPDGATAVEAIPTGTAQPDGWVYLSANLRDASSRPSPSTGWVMQLFVDRSDQVAATIPVPLAGSYIGALIETTRGTVYYTNIAVATYAIPIYLPGYNNMEGYGQGSGGFVELLPAYYKLTAEMTLNSWSTPQVGILSFQINAMNFIGTTTSTCVGFFQLGIDLDPSGTISPWYVPGKNCFAHFFLPSQNPAVLPGIPSPPGTHLILSIVYDVQRKQITFTIVDTTIDRTFSATRPYNGTTFYGMYTQLEFQPCCAAFSIQDYRFAGSLYDMRITTLSGATAALQASYMIPFTLDAPPNWDFTYYQDSTAGYQQIT